jgi:hypothetical protein
MDKWKGLHKHCNEFGAFQQEGEFIDELSYYQFMKDFCSMDLVNTFEQCTGPLMLELPP